MASKTCDRIIFYCKDKILPFKLNGKNVYASWPKLPHTDPSSAIDWAKGFYNRHPYFTVETENSFSSAMILDEVNVRGQSSKVPQGIVYSQEKDAYLMFDFRTDGLIETITNNTISKGVIKCDMAFRFAGGNYYFVPKKSHSFVEYEKSFRASNVATLKATTNVDIGVPFYGSFDAVHVYVGKFKCTDDKTDIDPSYENSTVYIYKIIEARYERYSVSKSKMKVKSLVDENSKEYQKICDDYNNFISINNGIITANHTVKAQYSVDNFKMHFDINTGEMKFVEEPRNKASVWGFSQ